MIVHPNLWARIERATGLDREGMARAGFVMARPGKLGAHAEAHGVTAGGITWRDASER